jgi:ABC-type sugar transport system ATPase subunit
VIEVDNCILEMRNITKFAYGENGDPIKGTNIKILENVFFNLASGEVHALLGENGAGKTTLMKILGGVIPQDNGEILVEGKKVFFRNTRESMHQGIAFVHQELNLCGNISIASNFFLANEIMARCGMLDTRTMVTNTREALMALSFNVDPRKMLGNLSTGQQQIVEIAKAISRNAKIIIMDEPTASLTKKEVEMLFQLIVSLKKQGVGIVYISHRLPEISEISDRISVLRDGKNAGEMSSGEFNEREIIRMIAGKTLNDIFTHIHNPREEIVLEIKNLKIGRKTNPINMVAKKGEIVGIYGLMGSGRSELLRTIFGAHESFGGQIKVFGENYGLRSPGNSIAKGIIYLSEDRKIDGLIIGANIKENTTMCALPFLFKNGIVSQKKEIFFAQKMVNEFCLKYNSMAQIVNTLSGGNQQRVSFAKSFAVAPTLLLLDEPTRGIDIGAKAEIYRMIDSVASSGISVILVSSDMIEIAELSDRVYIMNEGSIIDEISSREQISQESLIEKVVNVKYGVIAEPVVCE